MILTDEQEAQLYELATITGIAIDEFKKALFVFVDSCRESWGALVKCVEEINEYYLILDDKPDWNTPKKIVLKSQVLIRKPYMARARSTC
ncbi:hypothetical protein [Bacillus sp. OK048]|uniref:hypothetical protein n=1 Tax=Bacillus sp. OK048 TaxID=1882761 RepID=UPI00088BA1F5|nr:hypothetical protein [Bacillus sp. OK048]SDM17657.1 hypothetical protein SAMN05443253_102177 [Bacillus sp. OK048]